MNIGKISRYLFLGGLAAALAALAVLSFLLLFTSKGRYYLLESRTGKSQPEEKIEQYTAFIEKYPSSIPARLHLADLYLTLPDPDEKNLETAVSEYNAVLSRDPGNTEAIRKLADISFMRQDFPGAIDLYGKILDMAPADNDARKKFALSLYYSGAHDKASVELEKAINKDPDAPELNMIHAAVAQENEDLAGAIYGFRKAAEGYSANRADLAASNAYQKLGMVYMQAALFFDAAGAFKKAVKLNPRAILPHIQLASAYLNTGMFNKSIETIQSSPLGIEEWKTSYSLKETRVQPELRAFVHDILGKCYFRMGDLKNALWNFENAIRTGKEYPPELLKDIKTEISKRWKTASRGFEVGKETDGTVKSISDKRISVDLEGDVEGQIDASDVSWSVLPVDIQNSFLIGQDITARVLYVDDENELIKLGLKQLEPDPWQTAHTRYKTGEKISAPLVAVTRGGAYAELEEDIEGYISMDDISWTENITDVSTVLSPGQTVEALILSVNIPARKISLGIKQLEPDPWIENNKNFSKDQKVKGTVIKTAATGAVVDLGGGIRGFINNRDVSWTRDILLSSEAFTAGDEVDALVLEIDNVNRRLILGVKQLTPDPWDDIREKYIPGEEFPGSIIRTSPFGVHIELEGGLEAIYPLYQIAPSKTNALDQHYPSEEKVTVVIRGIDPLEKKIFVLIKEPDEDNDEEDNDENEE